MAKLKLIVAAIVVVALGTVLAWQHVQNDSLRDDNEVLRRELADLKQFSDVSAPASTGDAVSQEQRDELLKLRGEVTELRAQTNQICALKEANQKLQASIKEARAPRASANAGDTKKKGPEDALPQDIHPSDSWAYRGYATPDATVESVLWALMNGDKATMLRAFAPDMLPEIQAQMDKANFAAEVKKMNNAEFRVLDRQQLSDDEMVLTLYTTRQDPNGNTSGSTEKTVFQRINGDWKVTKKPAPGD